jgi:glycosyltransferase involved in cell wall biosynthesis
MSQMQAAAAPVAYLLKRFPRLSETFILHEILELERQGLDLRLFAILDPGEEVIHADVACVRAPVRYLPAGRRAIVPLCRAHTTLLRRDPRRYVGVAAYALQRHRHLSAIKHFVRAGWLALELERAGVGHLHAHFAHGPASVAHFVHLLTGLSYSFTAHAKDIYTSPPDLLALKMRAARFVVTCTGYNARYLAGLLGAAAAGRLHRIYHGLDLYKFSPDAESSAQLGSDPGRVPSGTSPTILAVGRLIEKKGFPYLVDAYRLLVSWRYDVRLCIVGSGEMKEALRRHIQEAGLEDRATLLGPRPQEELIGLYRAATIFTLPCIVAESGDRDGIPNVLVEAMRLGLPVVSTDVSGIPELVIDGETGLLVPPRDAQALAAALRRLLDDPALRAHLVRGAACRVATEFDLAANAARLKALLVETTA